MDRKLAAILAADVVGYSALMERDEKGTHERLTAGRKELFEPEIARHHGHIFKLMGDGMLAEFGSVVDAVECAVSLQRGLAERNADIPQGQRVLMRIGINLGEVIVEGEDRFGEGVNIAARLEQLADPGGICVSGKVAKEVEKKLAFGFEPMGEQKVKNIVETVLAFRVKLDGVPQRRTAAMEAKRVWPWTAAMAGILLLVAGAWPMLRETASVDVIATKPAALDGKASLVVLPFDNLSDDKEQGYLADGITEDLTTELARVPGLFVISRNAAFAYRDKATQPAQIAKELGMRYILEGSLRRGGEDMRVNAQLIDSSTGGHIWAERYDGAWTDVFALQDKIVGEIATALKLRLMEGPRTAEIAGGTGNSAAYEAFLQGLGFEYRGTPEDIAKAATFFRQALALEPDFGRATAELAYLHWDAAGNNAKEKALGLSHDETLSKTRAYLDEAAKHPSSAYYRVLADFQLWRQQSDESVANVQRAIALDPSDPDNYLEMSLALIYNGRAADSLVFLDTAMRVDPGWTIFRRYLSGLAQFNMGRFAEAVTSFEAMDPESPDYWSTYSGLVMSIATYGHLGRSADAASAMAKLKTYPVDTKDGTLSILRMQGLFPFKNFADTERVQDGLRRGSMIELPFGLDPKSKDRLTGAEIRKLIYGHETISRQLGTNLPGWSHTDAETGQINVKIGDWSDSGPTWIEGDTMCFSLAAELRTCAVVYRNPAGSFEEKNEYIFYQPWQIFEFSVVN